MTLVLIIAIIVAGIFFFLWQEEHEKLVKAEKQIKDLKRQLAGTASLSRELVPVSTDDLQIGDIFIIGGHPGHAMVIVDMAMDKLGNKAIMVSQSYMPAQDIHIVTNLNDKRVSPWYIITKNTKAVSFPEFYFNINQVMRFN